MTDWLYPVMCSSRVPLAALALCLGANGIVHADVFGRLHFVVTDADTDKPLAGATITLHDPTNVRGDVPLTADAQGGVTSPPLEIHAWQAVTALKGYDPDTHTTVVAADTTTEVDVSLEKTEKVITIAGNRQLVKSSQTNDSTNRGQTFLQTYPSTTPGGNPQDIKRIFNTTPGFVNSTVGADHPRGEHASTTFNFNGFLAPGALQGRAGPFINPNVFQNAEVQTGAYAPEYGSEVAAIVSASLRSGPITPLRSLTVQGGGYNTYFGDLTVGGQLGDPLEAGVTGPAPRRFRYFLDFSDRYTDNALEPPQPDDQSAHNHGTAATAFGNLEYEFSPKDQVALILNDSPAQTQIANRTGLPGKYAPVGQGYGYGGARNADGSESGATPDPTVVGSQNIPLASQQGAGQDIYQKDENGFQFLNYRHTFNDQLTGLLSAGFSQSRLDLRNNNPSINLGSVDSTTGLLTTIDNSIEFNPNLTRDNSQRELAASLTLAQGPHTYKAGFVLDGQSGNESYQFVPQSQLALDALYAVDTRLAPAGALAASGATDTLGNPVYLITPGASTPTLNVHRTGYYNAGYAQDTWRVTRRFTLNYGARLDSYYQKQSTQGYGDSTGSLTYLSPRLNAAYAFTPATVGRLSYNKLFTQPPLSEGAILGTALRPETLDQYDASIEHQIGATQTVKLAYYYKNIRNQNDTGILIPYTQIGAYTTLQYQYASVHGIEVSYDLTPRNNIGLGGYLAFSNSLAKPGGLDQTGLPAPIINDHDQRNTLSTGVSYTLPSQAYAALDYYFGSGEASSVLAPIAPSNTNVVNGGNRNTNQFLNVRLASPPKMIGGHAGLTLDVENVFNNLDVLNFNSGFSGTRFEQGRRVLLSVNGNF
ncbi:MAG: TonB-dependent receptor [Armatimonadetes bacterium]|nr:TonB-dependent receptor [Armatimonadota bacterium]